MMQGITALPGAQQAPQGQPAQVQAPGQAAPTQAFPQQQPMTPAAMTGQLQNLPPQQLLQMFANPADKTPKWAVVTAYAKAVEQQRLQEMVRGQQAMQQGQMQAQEMPVAAQVMSQPVMARHGGEMHGYAGGGAVAFQSGGPSVGYDRDYNDARRFGISLSPYDAPDVRAEKLARVQRMREFEEQQAAQGRAEIPTEASVQNEAALKRAFGDQRSRMRDVLQSAISQPPAPPRPPSFQQAGEMPPSAPQRRAGIASLESPEMRAALENQNRLMLEGARVTEEEKAARQGLDALSSQIIDERRAEEARRLSQAEKRIEEAKTRAGRSPIEDVAFLGQMIEGMRGSKRFGEALAGAAGGAGRAQSAREEALRRAEEKYDLTRNEVANLANLRQQVQLDQAKLMEARASGDANKIRAAQEKAAASQVELVKYEQSLGMKSREFELEEMKIQTQRAATSAASAQANQQRLMSLLTNTEARKQELIRNIVKNYKDSKKLIYTMADVPNAPAEAIKAKEAADRELAEIIRQQTQDLDKLMAQTARQIPGFADLYKPAATGAGGSQGVDLSNPLLR